MIVYASIADADLLRLNHSYIGDCSELLQDLYYLLAKSLPIQERHGLDPVPHSNPDYWRLKERRK